MQATKPNENTIYRLLTRIGMSLEIPVHRSNVVTQVGEDGEFPDDQFSEFMATARLSGIFLKEPEVNSRRDAIGFLREGFPVILAHPDGTFVFVGPRSGKKFPVTRITDKVMDERLRENQVLRLLDQSNQSRIFVAKKELECDAMSSHDSHGHGHHEPPLRRFLRLLNLDRRDLWRVMLFAFVSGVLTLATPLAVESLVNVVSWGTYLQPLVILGMVLLTCLGFAGFLKILQTITVEVIQQRQFVRIVGDLAHRFPRANRKQLASEFPREMANRVFDVMTIQKATAVLLLDGISIVLTTVLGLILLGFYHPFLLGFDFVLLLSMVSITWILGRGGIQTAIEESITKYRVVHWLQDVLASPSVFKAGGGELFAIERANQLTSDYIAARKRQFRVIIRQVTFAIGLQVMASTIVLALGGWLVIEGQLTLGQLVASELVVTTVVGAFAKAGKSLEKFYDLMAGVDKVGHLIDLEIDPRHEMGPVNDGPFSVLWRDVSIDFVDRKASVPSGNVEPGRSVAIVGNDLDSKSEFAKAIAGLSVHANGVILVSDIDAKIASRALGRKLVGLASETEVFHGTIRENISLGRPGIRANAIRKVLADVGLLDTILALPDGIDTKLQTGGHPFSMTQKRLLLLARAMVTKPRVLVIDRILDDLGNPYLELLWNSLARDDRPWTLVVVTANPRIASRCDDKFSIDQSFDHLVTTEVH